MKIQCPKCRQEIKPATREPLTGLIGPLFRRIQELVHRSIRCERCGWIPLADFSRREQRWFKIETGMIVLAFVLAISMLVITIIVTSKV